MIWIGNLLSSLKSTRALTPVPHPERNQFFIKTGEFPEHVLAALRVVVATEEELSLLEQRQTRGKLAFVSRRNEQASLRLLDSQAKKMRSSFPGTKRTWFHTAPRWADVNVIVSRTFSIPLSLGQRCGCYQGE